MTSNIPRGLQLSGSDLFCRSGFAHTLHDILRPRLAPKPRNRARKREGKVNFDYKKEAYTWLGNDRVLLAWKKSIPKTCSLLRPLPCGLGKGFNLTRELTRVSASTRLAPRMVKVEESR